MPHLGLQEITYPWRNPQKHFPAPIKAERIAEEQLRPYAADVWSLGMLLMWLMLGRHPIGYQDEPIFRHMLRELFVTSTFARTRMLANHASYRPSAPICFRRMLDARGGQWHGLIQLAVFILDVDATPTSAEVVARTAALI
jgi:serine/threonine protein kinase